MAALTLIGGALADSYGKARMLSLGCLLFGAASVVCALAPSIVWLIAARVGQGIAAALLTPASLALIGAVHPKDERTGAIAISLRPSHRAALTALIALTQRPCHALTHGRRAHLWIFRPVCMSHGR